MFTIQSFDFCLENRHLNVVCLEQMNNEYAVVLEIIAMNF